MKIIRSIHKQILSGLILAVASLASATFTRLPDLGAGGFASAVNESGQIVGGVSDPATLGLRPAVWDNGVLRQLPTGRFDTAAANAINDNGVVVGIANVGYNQQAVEWVNGALIELPDLGEGSTASDVNNKGQVVGYVNSGDEKFAATWVNGELTILPTPPVGREGDKIWTFANSINDNGQIVGTAKVAFGSDKIGVQWLGSVGKPLPLDGSYRFLETTAYQISPTGRVLFTGYSGPNSVFGINVLGSDLSVTTLPNLPGAIAAYPTQFNDSGVVVGYNHFFDSTAGVAMLQPTVWRDGVPTALDLEDGFRWGFPSGLNSAGLIVGSISDGVSGTGYAGYWSDTDSYPLTISSESGYLGSVITFTATSIEKGKPIAGREIRFLMTSGEIGRATTNKRGIAKLRFAIPVNMTTGAHQVMGSFGGGKYAPASLTVKAAPTALSVGSVGGKPGTRVTLQGNLTNKINGKALTGQVVNAAVGTLKATTRTKAAGAFSFNFDIAKTARKGTRYTVTFTYDGKEGYEATTVKATITVQ